MDSARARPVSVDRLDRSRTTAWRLAACVVLPVPLAALSFLVGRFPVDPVTVAQVVASRVLPVTQTWPDVVDSIVMQVRLPRIVLGVVVGGGLAIGGAAFQGIFRNPLVSPDILGVSAASGFGAALAILIGGGALLINGSAFAFGVLGVGLSFLIGRSAGTNPPVMLILSGVVVSAFFAALISVTKYLADPQEKLPVIVFWLLGSLASGEPGRAGAAAGIVLVGSALLVVLGWRIDLLSLGDDDARALGVRPGRTRAVVVAAVTVTTAAGVAVAGIIGWIGLVVPHLARMLVGPDHRVLLPASFGLGAAYLLAVDAVARAASSAEVPVGILTALLGAPFFAVLLRRSRRAWW